jgi:hypothetical protein
MAEIRPASRNPPALRDAADATSNVFSALGNCEM